MKYLYNKDAPYVVGVYHIADEENKKTLCENITYPDEINWQQNRGGGVLFDIPPKNRKLCKSCKRKLETTLND